MTPFEGNREVDRGELMLHVMSGARHGVSSWSYCAGTASRSPSRLAMGDEGDRAGVETAWFHRVGKDTPINRTCARTTAVRTLAQWGIGGDE